MEHSGPVVPIGEYALGRPAIAHDDRAGRAPAARQRRPLRRRHVGLADVGVRIEDVDIGRCDVHVAAHHRRRAARRRSSRAAPPATRACSGSDRNPEPARSAHRPSARGSRHRSQDTHAPLDPGSPGRRELRPRCHRVPSERGSPPHSTAPRRAGQPRIRDRRARRRAAPRRRRRRAWSPAGRRHRAGARRARAAAAAPAA